MFWDTDKPVLDLQKNGFGIAKNGFGPAVWKTGLEAKAFLCGILPLF